MDEILTGPPTPGIELLAKLERRIGSMKLVGERDDLLLDVTLFIGTVGFVLSDDVALVDQKIRALKKGYFGLSSSS
jgi:hypothetical protein